MDSPSDNNNTSGSSGATAVALKMELTSLEQFMAGKDDATDVGHYIEYLKLLREIYARSGKKSTEIEGFLREADNFLTKMWYIDGAIPCLNAAYQALKGPRPGDDLRRITPAFLVDGHQWKHYKNGDKKWGLFAGYNWEDVHRIIVYSAKKILEERALQIDRGATLQDQVLDGFVIFDQNVGTPGEFEKTLVCYVKVQISRTRTQVSGHGYPVPDIDYSFPVTDGVLATALQEALSKDNNSPRSKK